MTAITPSSLAASLRAIALGRPGAVEVGHAYDFPKIGVSTFMVLDDEGGVVKVSIEQHTKPRVKPLDATKDSS